MDLSDDGYIFGMAHFLQVGSTLSFGGDDAKMEITPRGRDALNDLISAGVVTTCDPLDSWPNREHYRSVSPLLPLPSDRPHLNPFGPEAKKELGWDTFKAKETRK